MEANTGNDTHINKERRFKPRRAAIITALAIAACATAGIYGYATADKSPFASSPSWTQDFSKMPNGPIDTKVWHHNTDYEVPRYKKKNPEKQGYTDWGDNARIEEGKLVIAAHKRRYQYPDDPEKHRYEYTSARIDTRHSFSFTYGKLEVTAKLPEGQGPWPAIWGLSATQPYTRQYNPTDETWQTDPRFYLHDGEIDMVETEGRNPCVINSTIHTYKGRRTGNTQLPDCGTTFNKYGLEWTPDGMRFTVNDTPYHEIEKISDDPKDWPFNQPFYLILNVAMGGEMGGEIDDSTAPWRMEIKDINYYPLENN